MTTPDTCKLCGSSTHDLGLYTTRSGEMFCFGCGRERDGLTPVPIDIDRDKVRDYCRDEESDDPEGVVGEWAADLAAAGAEWSDDSSISGAEVGWCMTLRQAFWLALNRNWFSPEGYYQKPVGATLASLLTIADDATGLECEFDDLTPVQQKDAVRQVTAEWQKYSSDPANTG